jgi:hypothetical protein
MAAGRVEEPPIADGAPVHAHREGWRKAGPSLAFVALFALLNVVLQVRYPGPEPRFWYLVPSIDLVVLFSIFALLPLRGVRVPKLVRIALVAVVLFVRFLRLGDGIEQRFLSRTFNLYVDLPLVPELVRLYYTTVPLHRFVLALAAVLGALAGLAVGAYRALEFCERYLSRPRHAALFAAIVVTCVAISPFTPKDSRRVGAFGASSTARIWREIEFMANAERLKRATLENVARVESELRGRPTNLARLERKNFFLFLIESYGQTVLERPVFEPRMQRAHASFERELGASGFSTASSLFESTTFGGGSWLAHATLATGVRTSNQFEYEVVCAAKPKTIARYFGAAGYRTVLVQPATTRRWPAGEFYGFDRSYFQWDFDYHGPAFGWAPMPDQYVLDFVRRSELGHTAGPLFIQYTLVSSHAPWNLQPALVEDWSTIGDGSVYARLEATRYPLQWSDLSQATDAYIRSLEYDFEVLKRYLREFVRDESLVVILGDHQPPAELTGQNASRGVPIHVVSRRRAFVDAFVAMGYTRGMRPDVTKEKLGMDQFLPGLLAGFSTTELSSGAPRQP